MTLSSCMKCDIVKRITSSRSSATRCRSWKICISFKKPRLYHLTCNNWSSVAVYDDVLIRGHDYAVRISRPTLFWSCSLRHCTNETCQQVMEINEVSQIVSWPRGVWRVRYYVRSSWFSAPFHASSSEWNCPRHRRQHRLRTTHKVK